MYILTFIVDIFFLSIWKHFICLYTWFIKLWILLWFLSQKLEWEYFSIDLLPYQDIFLDVNVSNSQKGCNKKDEDGAKRVLLLIFFFFFFFSVFLWEAIHYIEGISWGAFVRNSAINWILKIYPLDIGHFWFTILLENMFLQGIKYHLDMSGANYLFCYNSHFLITIGIPKLWTISDS